jgi:polyhydroxybutyrate depolymerase
VSAARRAALAAALLALAASPARGGGTDRRDELAHGGRTRSYTLHLPADLAGRPPLPLLLAFHGGGGNGRGFARYAGLDAVADREGFAVVYPDGTGRLPRILTWNAGRCCGYAQERDVDDVGFALALVEHLAGELAIDRRRVWATGHSNGAMMALRLAAQASDRVAAVAAVAGAMNLDAFEPLRPVPVLQVHSEDDPRAPFAGGPGPSLPFTRTRVVHAGALAELGRWVRHDGCPAEPRVAERRVAPAGRADAGHTATKLVWAPCAAGAEVALWRLTGAGHGWPGGETPLPERMIGPRTRVIDAAEEVYAFVRRFALPESSAAPDPGSASTSIP